MMTSPTRLALQRYLIGLACTFSGAWLTDATDSMWPLALGASASLLLTVPLVKALWTPKAVRRR